MLLLLLASCVVSSSDDSSTTATNLADRSESVTTVLEIEIEGAGTIVIERPVGCESQPGSPTDLTSEPAGWLAFGRYLRWTDRDGCPIRIDVISHIRGAEHCEYQSAEFITIGSQLGDSISDGPALKTNNNRYVWDPDGVLPGGPYAATVAVADLPPEAYDSGFRQGAAVLWLTTVEPQILYRVSGATAQIWHSSARLGLCA